MGFFDSWDGASVVSSSSKHHKSHKSSSSHKSSRKRSKSRSHSRDRKHRSSGNASVVGNFFNGSGSHYGKHNSSKASFFNLGNNSSRSLFGGMGMSRSRFTYSHCTPSGP